jgi:hypothetical protein
MCYAGTGLGDTATTRKPAMTTKRSTTVALLLLFGAGSMTVAADYGTAAKDVKTVRLLNVGNSFSGNATHYLKDLVAAAGHELVHHQASIGGGTMEQHWEKAQRHEKDPADPLGLYGSKRSLKQELTAEPWDFVTIQQASIQSHDIATYRPYAGYLRDYIKKYAPKAKLLVHQTWAYRCDDPRFAGKSEKPGEPANQEAMYQGLTQAYKTIAAELGAWILPVGEAFHLADTDPKWGYRPDTAFDFAHARQPARPDQTHSLHAGWRWQEKNGKTTLAIDGHHAGPAGEYLGACVFYEVLFRESVVGNTFVPPGVPPADARFLQETAHRAVAELRVANEALTLENVLPPTPNRPDEPLRAKFSPAAAVQFLDTAALSWQNERKCFACHANYIYLIARPPVSHQVPAHQQIRAALEQMAEHPREKPGKIGVAEAVMVAAVLASNDAATTGKLHPTTQKALDRVWTLQREDGGFTWLKNGQPPSEVDDQYGATMAAIGAGIAPKSYAGTPQAQAGLEKIRRYLRDNPPANLHHRAMRLLASQYVDGIMSPSECKKVVDDLVALQKPDGGWGLATFGNWQRSDGKEQDSASSDGYGTGFAVYVLRLAGVPVDDSRIQRGVAWLKTHQQQSGRWFTRSLWKDQKHYLTYDGTAYAVLALAACGEIQPEGSK